MITAEQLVRDLHGPNVVWREDETPPVQLAIGEGAAYFGTLKELRRVTTQMYDLQHAYPITFVSSRREVPLREGDGFTYMQTVVRVTPLERFNLIDMVKQFPTFEIPYIPDHARLDFVTGVYWIRNLPFEIHGNVATWRRDLTPQEILEASGQKVGKRGKGNGGVGKRRPKKSGRAIGRSWPSTVPLYIHAAAANLMEYWGFESVTECVAAAMMYFEKASLAGDVDQVTVPNDRYQVRAQQVVDTLMPFAETPMEVAILETVARVRNFSKAAEELGINRRQITTVRKTLSDRRDAILAAAEPHL
jgi:hypothetical protein